MRPVPRRERARRVDIRHPSGVLERLADDLAQERRFPTPARAENFRQSPSRQPTPREPRVECLDTRRQRTSFSACWGGKRVRKKIDQRLWKHRGVSYRITPGDREDCCSAKGRISYAE